MKVFYIDLSVNTNHELCTMKSCIFYIITKKVKFYVHKHMIIYLVLLVKRLTKLEQKYRRKKMQQQNIA